MIYEEWNGPEISIREYVEPFFNVINKNNRPSTF